MRRKSGRFDMRLDHKSNEPSIFFPNEFVCNECGQKVPDDAIVCPWCINRCGPRAQPGRTKHKPGEGQMAMPLEGSVKLS